MTLNGKVALVTEACGRIGCAIMARFQREGATVYAAEFSPEGLVATHDEDGSLFVKRDVTQEPDAVAAMARSVLRRCTR